MLSDIYLNVMKVGEIQGYDVIYIPEKDVIFCKNTVVKYSVIRKIVKGSSSRDEIPEKELVITKDNSTIHFGCLTTTISNCNEIAKNVAKNGKK